MRVYQPFGERDPKPNPVNPSAYASVLAEDDLETEAIKRRKGHVFPLDVFPEHIKPLIAVLVDKMQGERAFIGMSLLQAASTAIGSALRARMGDWEVCLSMWGCSVGISSSGKSMIQGVLLRPLNKIQDDYNEQYFDKLKEQEREYAIKVKSKKNPLKEDEPDAVEETFFFGSNSEPVKQKVVMFEDITFEALIKDVLQHNYKGVTRYADELLKWIDDMDRYKTGKSEASFWTASWSPSSSFTMRRAGGKLTYIRKHHLVASVMGSTQPDVIYRFYEQNRLATGYIFRMLWAFAETDRVISPDLSYRIPEELLEGYNRMIQRMYHELPMNYETDEPHVSKVSRPGILRFQEWQDKHTMAINRMDNLTDKNVKAGIFGKIKEYGLRIALILKVMDMCHSHPKLKPDTIEDEYIYRALKVCDYFMHSGYEAYQTAKSKVLIPPNVLEFAALLKGFQYNQKALADHLGITKQSVNEKLKRYMDKYPAAFQAKNS
ncbi:DUF3987 domain-containing protein [Larkinella insperata]|uniref:DUF3987 domain-containing protein n=1 Tax=Larkinella insperata TaxID=332158 RepID=A0ABW3QEV7_9BACT|nr:DUF3987 domain-containing protein [Larkinella insperata]